MDCRETGLNVCLPADVLTDFLFRVGMSGVQHFCLVSLNPSSLANEIQETEFRNEYLLY